MTYLQLDNEDALSDAITASSAHGEAYSLPLLPKMCTILNIIGAIFCAVFVILLTIANRQHNMDTIIIMSKLIFWFFTGFSVAIVSAASDYGARLLYKIEAKNGASFWKYGEVIDSAAVGMSFASAGVFCFAVWRAVGALHGVEVHF